MTQIRLVEHEFSNGILMDTTTKAVVAVIDGLPKEFAGYCGVYQKRKIGLLY